MTRNRVIQINVSKEEKETIENYCKNIGAKPASYARQLLFEKINGGI